MLTSTQRRPLPDRLLDASEAAHRLGVDVQTLCRWHASGAGPAPVATDGAGLAFWARALDDWQDRVITQFRCTSLPSLREDMSVLKMAAAW